MAVNQVGSAAWATWHPAASACLATACGLILLPRLPMQAIDSVVGLVPFLGDIFDVT